MTFFIGGINHSQMGDLLHCFTRIKTYCGMFNMFKPPTQCGPPEL